MIQIAMSQRADGTDVAKCGALKAASRNGAQMKLARMLVASGTEDQPWTTMRNRRVAMRGSSLHGLARLTVAEGSHSPRIELWQAFSGVGEGGGEE